MALLLLLNLYGLQARLIAKRGSCQLKTEGSVYSSKIFIPSPQELSSCESRYHRPTGVSQRLRIEIMNGWSEWRSTGSLPNAKKNCNGAIRCSSFGNVKITTSCLFVQLG
jgi:hypothetical protein